MTPTRKLDILVIEDTEKHQESAREQFKYHNLTIARNYEEGERYLRNASSQAIPESAGHYDVLLTDLMMPKGGTAIMGCEGMKYIFDLLPYGFPLAFLAAKIRIAYIGIVTDVNHHDHPISAAIDPISSSYLRDASSLYSINGSLLGIFHAPFTTDGQKDWKKIVEVFHL